MIENQMAGIMQVDNMIKWLMEKEWITKTYGTEYRPYMDAFWDSEKHEAKITEKQKSYINALVINSNREKAFEILDQFLKK